MDTLIQYVAATSLKSQREEDLTIILFTFQNSLTNMAPTEVCFAPINEPAADMDLILEDDLDFWLGETLKSALEPDAATTSEAALVASNILDKINEGILQLQELKKKLTSNAQQTDTEKDAPLPPSLVSPETPSRKILDIELSRDEVPNPTTITSDAKSKRRTQLPPKVISLTIPNHGKKRVWDDSDSSSETDPDPQKQHRR
jgi:hypothetical protein